MPERKKCKHVLLPRGDDKLLEGDDMLEDIVFNQVEFMRRLRIPTMLFPIEQTSFVYDKSEIGCKGEALSLRIQDFLACITNECEEIRDWLPWKHWKNYEGMDIELDEIRFEAIDILFFVLEMLVYLGMDAEDVHRYYISKMIENNRRQDEGYHA